MSLQITQCISESAIVCRDLSTPLKEASPTIAPLTLVGVEPHQELLSITRQEETADPRPRPGAETHEDKNSLQLPELFWKEAGENHDLRWKRNAACCLTVLTGRLKNPHFAPHTRTSFSSQVVKVKESADPISCQLPT